jgi:hypothetical protein
MEWEYSDILKSRKKTVVDGQDKQGFEQKNGFRLQVTEERQRAEGRRQKGRIYFRSANMGTSP